MWIGSVLTAAILTSFLPIINEVLLRDTGVWVVAWTVNAPFLPLLAVATYFLIPNTKVNTSFWLGVLGSGILNIFGFTAIALGPVGYVTALFKLSSVVTVILAYLILKEGAARQRILASGVIVAGAIVLAL